MFVLRRISLVLVAGAVVLSAGRIHSQDQEIKPGVEKLPNPYAGGIKPWGMLVDGRKWGSGVGVDIGPDGNVWAIERCGANLCEGSKLDPIYKFDRKTGRMLAHFGGGMFVYPHGLHVDRDGNVW